MSEWFGAAASLIWARVQIVLPYQKWAVAGLKIVCPPLVRWIMDRRYVRVALARSGEERLMFCRRFFRKRLTMEELRHFLEDIFQGRCDASRRARHVLSGSDQVEQVKLGALTGVVINFTAWEFDEIVEPRLSSLSRRYMHGG